MDEDGILEMMVLSYSFFDLFFSWCLDEDVILKMVVLRENAQVVFFFTFLILWLSWATGQECHFKLEGPRIDLWTCI